MTIDRKRKLPRIEKIRFVLRRFRDLPAKFWVILSALFGMADFLTWSILGNIPNTERLYWTLGIVGFALVITIVAVMRIPSVDEKMAEARILERLAREEYNKRQYIAAESLLKRAVNLDPKRVSSWGLLGKIQQRLGKYREAIPSFSLAIELTQTARSSYLHGRGMVYALLGDYGLALDDFDESLKASPRRKNTLRWRAIIWLYLGRYENALEDLNSVLKHYPRYVCGRATKAIVLHKQGETDRAEKELARCISLGAKSADDFYCIAIAHSQITTDERALTALEVAITRNSKYRARALVEPFFTELRGQAGFHELLDVSDENGGG